MPCDDPCLHPLSYKPCSTSSNKTSLSYNNQDICFGVWCGDKERILFDQKMSLSLVLTYKLNFIDTSNNMTLSSELHTSCSKPLHPSYATRFTPSSCNDYYNTDMEQIKTLIVQFKDDISVDYHN